MPSVLMKEGSLQRAEKLEKDGCRLKGWRNKWGCVGSKHWIKGPFYRLREPFLNNNPGACWDLLRCRASAFIFPMYTCNRTSAPAVIWEKERTAWSTLVTLEIRIGKISWRRMWEKSSQVGRNSAGHSKSVPDHAVTSAELLSARWMSNCCSRCAQNPSELQTEWCPKTKGCPSFSQTTDWESWGIIVIRLLPFFIMISDLGLNVVQTHWRRLL